MAINNSIFAPSQSCWGIAEETTFGTAVADTGSYEMVEGPIPTVDYGLQRDFTVKNDLTRVARTGNQYSTTTGTVRAITFADAVIRRTDLCNYMVAVMQNVTEGTATPYQKTFTWTVTNTQPLFSSNAGKFYTVGVVGPIASYMQKFTSCILKDLTLKSGPQGRLAASGTWISGFAPATTANFTTTNFAFQTQNYYNCHAMSLKQIAGSDVVLYDWSLKFENGAVPMSWGTTGYVESYALACDANGYKISGSLTMKYDAVTQGYIADALAGTPRKIQLSIGTGGQAGYFDVTLNACLFDAVDKDYGKPEGQAIVVPFIAGYNGSDAVATITVQDGVDQTWTDF